ncbi:MAG: IS1/IS1595 family N-terminal zinc-binding domain-containing protein, partial [Microcystaceae cyanobacterium]
MNCPKCDSNNIRKNGHRRGKQNYQCKNCSRQFIELVKKRSAKPL